MTHANIQKFLARFLTFLVFYFFLTRQNSKLAIFKYLKFLKFKKNDYKPKKQ